MLEEFRLSPNGCGGEGVPAGTDKRCFHRPPNLVECSQMMMKRMDGYFPSVIFGNNIIGTDEQQFCRQPDPVKKILRLGYFEAFGMAVTEVCRFRAPVDG